MEVSELAEFRVNTTGVKEPHTRTMTDEQILDRRAYIRQMLKDTPWRNLNNDVLDNMRLLPEENNYILEDADGGLFFIPGKVMATRAIEFRKVRAMMPFEFMNLTGKDFDWDLYSKDITEAKMLVNNFIIKFEQFRKEGMGLYIESTVKGSGKTMLSCCILNELAKRYPITIKFINSLDLLELTKQSYKGVEPEELTSLYQATVIVIDDIGVQMSREWIDTVFYRLVNTRYNNKLITIYTSNVSAQYLKMDERVTDRIEATTYRLLLPDEAVRSRIRTKQKEEILDKIKKAPA